MAGQYIQHVGTLTYACIDNLANKLLLGEVKGGNSEALFICQTEQLVGMGGGYQPAGLRQPVYKTVTNGFKKLTLMYFSKRNLGKQKKKKQKFLS